MLLAILFLCMASPAIIAALVVRANDRDDAAEHQLLPATKPISLERAA